LTILTILTFVSLMFQVHPREVLSFSYGDKPESHKTPQTWIIKQ